MSSWRFFTAKKKKTSRHAIAIRNSEVYFLASLPKITSGKAMRNFVVHDNGERLYIHIVVPNVARKRFLRRAIIIAREETKTKLTFIVWTSERVLKLYYIETSDDCENHVVCLVKDPINAPLSFIITFPIIYATFTFTARRISRRNFIIDF